MRAEEEEEERHGKTEHQKHQNGIQIHLENIKKTECSIFVEDSSSEDAQCVCGRVRDRHGPSGAAGYVNTAMTDPRWDAGELRFAAGGCRSPRPFLRLSSGTEPHVVYDLMTKGRSERGWGLSTAKLVLSVAGGGGGGGAKVQTRVHEFLREGLVKALKRTGAWILTEGLHEGVGRCVGEAVRVYNMAASPGDCMVLALGVSPWGLVHNRQELVNAASKDGFHVEYSTTTGDSCCLDDNHEAFLLVDDGSAGQRGGEVTFRAKLEDYISKQRVSGSDSINIPVLCLLISGEATMLERVDKSLLRNSTPWLVLAGTGGVADLLSDILEDLSPAVQSSSEGGGDAGPGVDLRSRVAEHIRKHFPSEAQNDKVVDRVLSIYQNRQLITIYRRDQETPDDFGIVLLKALARARKHKEGPSSCSTRPVHKELELAFIWNRLDFAKSELFSRDMHWTNGELNVRMREALVNNEPRFVRLFVESGFDVQAYLTHGELEGLYRSVAADTPACRLLLQQGLEERPGTADSQRDISLYEVDRVLKMLIGQSFYLNVPGLSDLKPVKAETEPCQFPWTSLFIWAVLQNRSEMAVFFWEMAEEPVLSALSARKMLREMSKMKCEADVKLSMRELAGRFEKLAHGVYGSCYQSNRSDSFKLLTSVSPVWGKSCLQMAMAANARLFISHDGVQAKLSNIWWGDMKRGTQMWKVILTLFCPVLCCTSLIFSGKTEETEKKSRCRRFCGAPVTSFVANVVMYFLFLALYTYVLLVDFKPAPPGGPAISELVMYFWVFTFVCEKFRTAFSVGYMLDFWNKYDLTTVIVFIIGVFCRMFEWSYEFGRCVLAIDFIFFTLRLNHVFAAHKQMGPKLIVVARMMKDLSTYLVFLALWLMAYGVANQALLYAYDPNPDRIFRRVLYRPFMHIFGYFPTEELDVGQHWDMNCTANVTQIDAGAEPCRSEYSNWLVIILLVVFILVTNVLLINLLIATLRHTFWEVQHESAAYWKFHRYHLIMEYKTRPFLAPPFIIISHLINLFRWAWGKIFCCGGKARDEECKWLMRWEMTQKKEFLTAQRETERGSDSGRLKLMSDKVDNVDSVLKQATETRDFEQRLTQMSDKVDRVDSVLKQLTDTTDNFDHRQRLETEMEKCSKALSWIMDTLAQSTLDKSQWTTSNR